MDDHGNDEVDPYYTRKSVRDSQDILFWVSLAFVAMLLVVVGVHFLESLGWVNMPAQVR